MPVICSRTRRTGTSCQAINESDGRRIVYRINREIEQKRNHWIYRNRLKYWCNHWPFCSESSINNILLNSPFSNSTQRKSASYSSTWKSRYFLINHNKWLDIRSTYFETLYRSSFRIYHTSQFQSLIQKVNLLKDDNLLLIANQVGTKIWKFLKKSETRRYLK